MGVWTEIVDYTVPSNTTSVVLDSFGTITKDDFVKVVFTIVETSTNYAGMNIYPNSTSSVTGYNTTTNYTRQYLGAGGTSVFVGRQSNAIIGLFEGASTFTVYCKLSENNKWNMFANNNTEITSEVQNIFSYVTSHNLTFNDPITSLTFTASATNGIGTGSRIQIYKLTAEKVVDLTVYSNTTQVDLTGFTIDKDSEYLLVSDIGPTNQTVALYVNDNTTFSNYYAQRIEGNGSSAAAERWNNTYFMGAGVSYTHIKLSNIGAFTFQSYNTRNAGTNNIQVGNYFGSSIAENITSITKLNVVTNIANAITAGNRFQLYKLY